MAGAPRWHLTEEQGDLIVALSTHLDQMLDDVRSRDAAAVNVSARELLRTWADRRWLLHPAIAPVFTGTPSPFSIRSAAPPEPPC